MHYSTSFSKRILSLFLLCSVVVAAFSFLPSSASENANGIPVPVYAYCGYELVLDNAVSVAGHADNGKYLTDREYTEKDAHDNDGWVAFRSGNTDKPFTVTVTLDLKRDVGGLRDFYIRIMKNASLNAAPPEKTTFSVSSNGKKFTPVGEAETKTDVSGDNALAIYYLTSAKTLSARYVRVSIECAGAYELWLNEVACCTHSDCSYCTKDYSEGLTFTDDRGITYRISDGEACVTGFSGAGGGTEAGSLSPSKADFDSSGTYTLGEGSTNPVTVISDLISTDRINYSGVPNNIRYIVIHNTATVQTSTDAKRYNYRLHNATEETSWHYTVDSNIVYHSLADSIVGFHAGSSVNYKSLGIEICVNGAPINSKGEFILSGSKFDSWVKTTFRPALKNTAMLVAELLTRYGLSPDAVIQHYDSSEKNCPLWMRSNGKGGFTKNGVLWLEFIQYVNEYYSLYNLKGTHSVDGFLRSSAAIPDYIVTSDGFVLPVASVSDYAFSGCGSSLKSIFIPATVTEIAQYAFYGRGLNISVSESSKSFFSADGVLRSSGGAVIYSPTENGFSAPKEKENGKYSFYLSDGRYYALGVTEKTSLAVFLEEYGAAGGVSYSLSGKELSLSDAVGSFSSVRTDDTVMFVIVKGDGDGDGIIGVSDYILAKRSCLGTISLLDFQRLALSLDGSERVTAGDYIRLKRHVLGTYTIK